MVCIYGFVFISAVVHPFFYHLPVVVRSLYRNTTRRWRLATFLPHHLQGSDHVIVPLHRERQH